MSSQKILSHILMWLLIGSGVFLVFLFIPSRLLLPYKMELSWVIIVPLSLAWIYFLLSSLHFRFQAKPHLRREEKLVQSGMYARYAHPTCMSAVYFSWIIFLLFPNLRILVSVIWMSLMVISWIEIEKSAFKSKKKFPGAEPGP